MEEATSPDRPDVRDSWPRPLPEDSSLKKPLQPLPNYSKLPPKNRPPCPALPRQTTSNISVPVKRTRFRDRSIWLGWRRFFRHVAIVR